MSRKIKRKNDNYLRDAFVLCGITLVLALILGGVYMMTKEPIDEAAEKGKQVAYQNVFPDNETINIVNDEELTKAAVEYEPEDTKTKITEAVKVTDAAGSDIGTAYIAATKGYGGTLTVSVGVNKEGVVTGIDIVSMNETAGLGANCTKDDFKAQYAGKSGEISVTKSETPADNEISAISGATITSDAVTDAVNKCLSFAESYGL